MVRIVLPAAIGLVLVAATQQPAAAQALLASALPAAGPTAVYAAPTSPAPSTTPTPMLVAQIPPPPPSCAGVSPYDNYACLDAYLGDDVIGRLYNYYKLEWGQPGPPADPSAPPSRIDGWPRTPQTTPPMPFTEWPYGGTTSIGVTRTGSVDSPLMVAIANTGLGRWMNEWGFQVYGWVDPGFNFSSNQLRKPGGNAPVAYAYIP